jgi:hypothetical protein
MFLNADKQHWISFSRLLIFDFLFLFLLGFVDEGRYDLSFLKDGMGLLTLLIYFLALTISQAILDFGLLKNFKNNFRLLIVWIASIPIALMILALTVFLVLPSR